MSHHKPDPNKRVNLTIDGKPVNVPEGTTILEAARTVNVVIPTLCDHPELRRRAVCRLCVVECDGRGKLVAACANDVWEGVSVVTHNARIVAIRKMIIELLLADHPPKCLTCIRSKNCELQTLAANYGISSAIFRHTAADRRLPEAEGDTLVRDMSKCVKCGRCAEVCQEVQTVRAINTARRGPAYEICTPYEKTLSGGSCVFCGQCAEVCPVGAIYECEHHTKVWDALNGAGNRVLAQISSEAADALGGELGYPPGTVTMGRMASALKRIGFCRVIDSADSAGLAAQNLRQELLDRIEADAGLPLVASCSPGWGNFVEKFYPDLTGHLPKSGSPEQILASYAKGAYSAIAGTNPADIFSVSLASCIAKKHETRRTGGSENNRHNVDFVLSPRDLARLFCLAGIEFTGLPEGRFDTIGAPAPGSLADAGGAGSVINAALLGLYGAYNGKPPVPAGFREVSEGICEAETDLPGKRKKALIVTGLDNARRVMDSIRGGECNAAFVAVRSCPSCDKVAGL